MAPEPQSKPSFTPRRKWGVGLDVIVRTLLVLAVMAMLNHLGALFFHRQYLSASTKVELSSRTRNLLATMTNAVTVTIYYNRGDAFYPTIAALLREYQALNPKVNVETVDYLRDASAAGGIKKDFELPEATEDSDKGKNFVLFKSGNEKRVVPGEFLTDTAVAQDQQTGEYFRRTTAFKGETAFTAMLMAVTNPKPLKAYVLRGHGEHDIESGDELSGYLDFKHLMQQNGVMVEDLSLIGTNAVPADCNLLIIPGPRRTVPRIELEKIDRYLDEGGRLFVMFNAEAPAESGLEELLAKKWGVLVTDSIVMDTNSSISSIKMTAGSDVTIGSFSTHPAVKGLINFNLNLYKPRFLGERRTRDNTTDAPSVKILFVSPPTSTLANNPGVKAQAFSLAVAVEKKGVPGVVTGRGNTRMIIVGDSFFLANGRMKLLANRDFAHYALNWLLDRPQFTEGIGPKPFSEFRMTLTTAQMNSLRWLLIGALPGAIMLFGGLVWLRRRK